MLLGSDGSDCSYAVVVRVEVMVVKKLTKRIYARKAFGIDESWFFKTLADNKQFVSWPPRSWLNQRINGRTWLMRTNPTVATIMDESTDQWANLAHEDESNGHHERVDEGIARNDGHQRSSSAHRVCPSER
jgi:hypothetical protein